RDVNITFRSAKLLLRVLKLRQRIIEQHDLPVTVIFVRQPAKARSNFQQPSAALGGEKAAQRESFDTILILASLALPEVGAIGRTLVVTNWRLRRLRLGHRALLSLTLKRGGAPSGPEQPPKHSRRYRPAGLVPASCR